MPMSEFPSRFVTNLLLRRLAKAHARQRAHHPSVAFTPEILADAVVFPSREQWLASLPKGLAFAELGVDEGRFSDAILTIAEPSKLLLVDVWADARYSEAKYRHVSAKYADHPSVSILRRRSVEAAADIPDDSLDVVYIDTDHSYVTTAAELRAWAPKLRSAGILAGHDFLPISPLGTVVYGVQEAVAEFCTQENWMVKHITLEPGGSPSFGVMKR